MLLPHIIMATYLIFHVCLLTYFWASRLTYIGIVTIILTMSRLIVKNLPNGVSYPSESHHPGKENSAWGTWKRACFVQMKEERFKSMFAAFGTVTDCSLKFTKDGKFRKFGFVGFRSEEEANRALKHLNKSFVDTSRVTVYTPVIWTWSFLFVIWRLPTCVGGNM